jgi:perosamine synthetase
MNTRILYTKPSITDLEVRYATDAATFGWGERCYEYISRFEAAFTAHVGTRHALATSSCTGAMHMGLAALGIGPHDEVILADTNWIATAAPIVHLGAKPVLVDVRPDTWCIDPDLVERAITGRTKAIIATHLYGNLCDMDRLLAIGEARGVPVVEDAAEALGSVYRNRRAGSMGCFGVFSFHGSKTVTTGEGGMLVTDDDGLYERVLTLSNHGRARGETRQFWPATVGYKYKMSNIQASIGCAQMERIEDLLMRKRVILSHYRTRIEVIHGARMNPQPPGTVNGAWMPTVVFDESAGVTGAALIATFRSEKIDARVFFSPLSSLPTFGGKAINPVAASLPTRAINLPSYHDMTVAQIDRVADVVVQVADTARALRRVPAA